MMQVNVPAVSLSKMQDPPVVGRYGQVNEGLLLAGSRKRKLVIMPEFWKLSV
jgi:hypothetical protein